MVTSILMNIVLGNGLLPNDAKTLHEPMLTNVDHIICMVQ